MHFSLQKWQNWGTTDWLPLQEKNRRNIIRKASHETRPLLRLTRNTSHRFLKRLKAKSLKNCPRNSAGQSLAFWLLSLNHTNFCWTHRYGDTREPFREHSGTKTLKTRKQMGIVPRMFVIVKWDPPSTLPIIQLIQAQTRLVTMTNNQMWKKLLLSRMNSVFLCGKQDWINCFRYHFIMQLDGYCSEVRQKFGFPKFKLHLSWRLGCAPIRDPLGSMFSWSESSPWEAGWTEIVFFAVWSCLGVWSEFFDKEFKAFSVLFRDFLISSHFPSQLVFSSQTHRVDLLRCEAIHFVIQLKKNYMELNFRPSDRLRCVFSSWKFFWAIIHIYNKCITIP